MACHFSMEISLNIKETITKSDYNDAIFFWLKTIATSISIEFISTTRTKYGYNTTSKYEDLHQI